MSHIVLPSNMGHGLPIPNVSFRRAGENQGPLLHGRGLAPTQRRDFKCGLQNRDSAICKVMRRRTSLSLFKIINKKIKQPLR